MATRSRLIIVAALAMSAVSLAAVAGCGAGPAARSGTSSGPAASEQPTSGGPQPSGVSRLASPPGPTPDDAAATGTTGSGIAGVTVVDGGCPVQRLDSPCPNRPLLARLTVTDTASGTLVTAAVTDPAGRFRLPLPPGQYTVRATNPNGAPLPRAPPTTTTVTAGRYTTLTIQFDSGIR